MYLPARRSFIFFLKKLSLRGFSLIEILIVITIIGILSSVGVGFAASIQKNTRDVQRESDLRVLQSAIQQFYADKNYYPNTDLSSVIANGNALTNCSGEGAGCTVSKTYLSKTPKDPNSPTTNYCYSSQFTISSTTACSIADNAGKCHFYKLYAKLENPPGTATYTCNGVTTYNFEITPL